MMVGLVTVLSLCVGCVGCGDWCAVVEDGVWNAVVGLLSLLRGDYSRHVHFSTQHEILGVYVSVPLDSFSVSAPLSKVHVGEVEHLFAVVCFQLGD